MPGLDDVQLGRRARQEADFLFDDTIVAKPLAPAGMEVVKSKNSNNYLRWINAAFNGGQMYEEAKAAGYANVTSADVDIPGVAPRDGVYRVGDLILMKLPKAIALGAMKANAQRALRRADRSQDVNEGRKNLKDALNSVSGASQQSKQKISVFAPGAAETAALAGGK